MLAKGLILRALTLTTALAAMLVSPIGASQLAIASDDNHTQAIPTLFVVTSKSATIEVIKHAKTNYQVKLNDIQPMLTYFSDKPNREAGTLSAQQFLALWQANMLNQKKHRPNVSLVGLSHSQDEEPQVFVFAMREPIFDAKTGTLTFTGEAIGENKPSRVKTTQLAQTSVFVDDIGWSGNKFKPHKHG